MSEPNYACDAPPEQAQIEPPATEYSATFPRKYSPGIAIIGCGGIAATQLEAYRDAGWNVVALCDHTPAKAAALGDKYFPHAEVINSEDEVFARKDVEVVDLTPHPEDRKTLIAKAIKAGKHILSQKPFVLDLDVGVKLCDAADAAGVTIAVNQNGRWAPHLAYMRETVRAGRIGTPTAVRIAMQWDHNWIAGMPFDNERHIILYDFAIHWFDFVSSIFSGERAQLLFASIRSSPTQKAKPPLIGHIAIEYPNALATLSFDADCKVAPEDRTVIVGTNGVIRSEGPSLSIQEVTVTTPTGWYRPKLDGSWFPGGFAGAMAELLAAIESKTPPQHNARTNLDSLALCFAAVTSAEQGRAVKVGEARQMAR